MAQVTRDIIQLKKSKTGDIFYPETHMQAVIGLNGNKNAKTVLAGPVSGSAGPASFRPLYPTDIIPLFTKEYTYKCTANDTNNGNIYFMNVTPTSDDWATPWSVHYTLQVDCLTSEDANSKYCHGFYDIYVGSAGSNYYYHVFNTFYSSSYYPVYYHKLLYHNTEAKYTNYHITNPVKLGARIQSAWGANTRTRIYNIKVYDYKNCTISFPENIEIYGDVYSDTYYNTIDWNATSTGLQETSDQNDTTTMNLYYTRLQAGTNGIKQSSLVMQDKNGKWQSFTKGAGGTATTKEKNDAEFRLGSRIYRIGRSSDLGADEYLGNGQVQAYYGLVDLRYSLNITSNNSATGGSVGLTQYKPVYIVGTINSNGYFVLDDIWWTQDEPITEDGKIYIRVIDSVYLDNPNNPNGQYRGDLISDGNAYYYKNGSFQRYVIADSANTVPWSGVTGRPSFYDLVIKASDATTLLTYKPTTSGTYQLTLNKSNIGLGNVENTALSTWIGSNKITTVGTITSGTWNGSTIAIGKGGTGLTTYTKGDMLYASTNNTLAKLGANTGTKKFLSMASSVPSWEVLATTDLPAMYIGKTAVKFENTTEQALTGISTGAFSSSITVGNGSAPASNEQASTTQKRRIYFGSSNYYIEVDKNGYLHTNVGFYSDSFVSAGGLSNAGGSSGIDSDALWELLAASTSEQINSSHLPKGSAADLTSGTSTTGVAWGAKTIADYVTSQINTSISSALYFRGQSTTAITNGGTETATINGYALVAKTGDLVLYNGKEFAWDGSHWIQFGDESSWASKNISISTSGYLTGGGDLTTSRTISINTNKISDSSAASSLSSTSTNLVTERDIYYGLPTINNSHAYTSGTTIYAPTSAGTANQVLLSGGANTAPTWGNASGLSVGTASKLGSSTIGSTTKPIYLSSGTAIECNTYAGGTAVTLNGTSKAASTASFYAPTGAGTSGYILKSNGSGEPSWVAQSTLSVGTASKLGSATIGSAHQPIYLNSGTPTAINNVGMEYIGWSFDGHNNLKSLENLYFSSGCNVFAFLNPAFVSVEYTNDGGTTWNDYEATDGQKINLFTTETSAFVVGKKSYTEEKTNNDALRITVSVGCGVYVNSKFVIIRGYFAGGCTLKVEYTTYADPTTFVEHYSIVCYDNPGNIIVPLDKFLFGNNGVHDLRFTLQYTGSTYPTQKKSLDEIYVYANNVYSTRSNYARTGHIYSIDSEQTAIFPGQVRPSENNVIYLGDSSFRWKTIYGTALNLNGAITGATTGSFSGDVTISGNIYLANNRAVYIKDSGGTSKNALYIGPDGHLIVGRGQRNGSNTYIEGDAVYLRYGGTNAGITLASTGAVTISGATTLSSTLAVASLATLSGGISLGTQYTPSGSSTAVDSKLVWDNTNKAWHLIGNFYADGFISAGGLSNGSGTGGVDIDAVWSSLTNSSSDNYASTKIHTNHLPTIEISGTNVTSGSGTYTYTSASSSKLALTINVKDTTYSVVSSSANGLVPKTGSAASATIATQSTEWVLTTTSGGAPTWRKLPSAAFSTDTNTWRGVYTGGTSRVGTGTGTKAINFVAGNNVTVSYEAAGTGSGQSGSADYFNVKIAATDTKYTNGTGISLSGTTFSLNVAGAKTALGLGSMAYETKTDYVLVATAQTISAKHTFSSGILLNTASSWTNSERAIAFSADGEDANIRYYYTDSNKGLTFNPSNGELRAAKFIKRGGTSSQFLMADGSVDSTTYVPTSRTVNGKALSANVTISLDDVADGSTRKLSNYVPTTRTVNSKALSSNITLSLDDIADGSTRKLSNYVPTTRTVNSKALSSNITLTLDDIGNGSTRSLSNYVLNAGDTMSGDLIIEKTGGGLTIRGERLNSNANGGYIYLAGRYYDNDRNGVKIAAEYPGSVGYDVQDLVVYTSYNRSGNASPVWQEAMRIKADTSVTIGQAESITMKNGGTIKVIDNADTPSSLSALYMSSNNNLIIGYGTATAGYNTYLYGNELSFRYGTSATIGMRINSSGNVTIGATDLAGTTSKLYVDGALVATTVNGYTLAAACAKGVVTSMTASSTSTNLPTAAAVASLISEYLPLAGGTMTGSIKLPNGSYINANSGYSMLGIGSGGETFYCGPGAEITNAFYLRSGNINLTHVKAGTNYTIWDASNSNLSTVNWAANNLTAAGIGTFDRVVLSNSGAVSHIEFTRAGWNYVSVPTDGVIAFNTGGSGSANTSMAVTPDGIRPGTKAVHSCGLPTAYWGSIYGQDLYLGGDAYNTAAGSIIFSEKLDAQRNGFKIAPVHAAAANRVNLVFYRSNVGSSPYAPSWTTFMTLSYDGKVTIAGSLTTSGDQVISSDVTLKTNWKELNYTVKDIANVKIGIFDWKDGHGTSAGSVAQDWKKLVPELVHGEEGNMTLAYGQIALLNTVMLARRSEDHETRIKALEAENAKLKEEIKRLKS